MPRVINVYTSRRYTCALLLCMWWEVERQMHTCCSNFYRVLYIYLIIWTYSLHPPVIQGIQAFKIYP